MEKEIFDLLCALIRRKGVSADAEAVNRSTVLMENFLKSKGLFCTVEDIDGRLVLFASTAEGKEPDYLLNAHLDVVPGLPEQFEPELKDGVLYGRGVHDCLGCAVAIARTLCLLQGENVSCGAIFSADEEIGGLTGAGMLTRGYGAKKGVFVLDCSFGKIVYSEKGMITLQLTARSKTGGGHASRPWDFENPVDKLIDGYIRLRDSWQNPPSAKVWGDSIAATVLRAGEVHNQIPDTASMVLNIRYVEKEGMEEILRKVQTITGCECSVVESCLPVTTDPDEPMLRRLKEVLQKHITDREVIMGRMTGATDARHFVKIGVPVAILGVDGGGAHAATEYLKIDSVEIMAQALADFVRSETF